MRIAIYTLGCKVNQLESWAMADEFSDTGKTIVDPGQEADIYIINTCAVTARAACQSRQMIRRFKREHPDAKIVATGCYIQTSPPELEELAEDVFMVGNDSKHLLSSMLSDHYCPPLPKRRIGDIAKTREITLCNVKKPRSRTRGYLKIQDGCNAFCSYCIVPYTRGRSRSRGMEDILRQMENYRRNNVKEVIVTGIHAGMYGHDLDPQYSLLTLLKNLCKRFHDIRFRLSSIEPIEITEEMILWASETENFCPHWHIPLQSGSDRILSMMNRRYNRDQFMEITSRIRAYMPDAAIGADVMAGFPSETEKDFMDTLNTIDQSPVTYIHAFPYSQRHGTRAAAMEPQTDKKEKKRRASEIRLAGDKKKKAFYRSQVGSQRNCLIEQRDKKTGMWRGFTENYLPVFIEGDKKGVHGNQFQKIVITKADKDHCISRLKRDHGDE